VVGTVVGEDGADDDEWLDEGGGVGEPGGVFVGVALAELGRHWE